MITIKLEEITPEIAKDMLSRLFHGQKGRLSNTSVAGLARQMRAGTFLTSPQGLIVSENDQLMDGQNRLFALVQAGVTLKMFVARGVPEDLWAVLDRGRPRSLSFIRGENKADTAIIACICDAARYGLTSVKLENDLAETTYQFVADAMDAFQANANRSHRPGVTTAPLKAGVVLNLQRYPDSCDEIMVAYNSIVSGDVRNSVASVGSLYARLTGANSQRMKLQPNMMLSLSWRCFDPAHFGDTKLVIRDPNAVMKEIRGGVLKNLRSELASQEDQLKLSI